MKRHEKEFEQYLEDWKKHERPWELWETSRRNGLGCWFGWLPMDDTDSCYFGFESWDFRRKPETIRVGDYELPKPITEEPIQGQAVWGFTPEYMGGIRKVSYFQQDPYHYAMFKNHCLHTSKESVMQWAEWWREVALSQLG